MSFIATFILVLITAAVFASIGYGWGRKDQQRHDHDRSQR
jgi:hypothetical protein